MNYNYNKKYKDMKCWLNDDKRTLGANSLNVACLRELKDIDKELGKIGVINFFLLSKLGVEDVRMLMNSARRQRTLVQAVCKDLKKYKVDVEYKSSFEYNIKKLKERLDYSFFITKENIRMTKYYPYFEKEGFDKLLGVELVYSEDENTPLDCLIEEIDDWNKTHEEEVLNHMASIKEEKETTENFRKEKKEKIKEERRIERKNLREQKKYEDMIIKNKEDTLKEIRRQKAYDEKHYHLK